MQLSLPAAADTLDFFGFYLPSLMLWAPLALVPFVLLCWSLKRIGFYRHVWHRALFDMALYVMILGGILLARGTGWP